MTAKRAFEDKFDDLPLPPWVRPLSFAEQGALIKEAEDSLARGEGIPHEEAMRMIDEMIAELKR